jgi:HK97 family phage major capsid protein
MSDTMLEELRQKHSESLERLQEWHDKIQALPLDANEEEAGFLRSAFEKTKEEVRRWAESVERQEVIATARSAMKPQVDDEPVVAGKPSARANGTSREPLTYRQGGDNRFFADLRDANRGDHEAQARLQRHATEMRVELRDISSTATAGGEFIPPLYLQNQWIELLRAGRPTADAVQTFPLPMNTMSINLPRLATGGSTAIQTAENAAVQETDPTTAVVTSNTRTIAGQVDMSRQLFEFSQPGMDEILFRDLARDYATKLDIQVLSGTGSAGQALGIRNVASINTIAGGTTATAAALWPKVASAISSVTSAYLTPDTIVMHPRRVAFFRAALDTQNRPLFDAVSPLNSLGNVDNQRANGVVGTMQGLRVIADPNIPTNVGAGTNEDVIIVFDSSQLYLWEEGAPRSRVFEDVGSQTQTVRLSVWGYFNFMGNRYPAAISVITGTALVTPTF